MIYYSGGGVSVFGGWLRRDEMEKVLEPREDGVGTHSSRLRSITNTVTTVTVNTSGDRQELEC